MAWTPRGGGVTAGFRVDTATSPPQLTNLDVEEMVLGTVVVNSRLRIRRGGGAPHTDSDLWVTAGGFRQPSNLNGYLWRNMSSAGLVTISMFTDVFDHPMGQDLTTDPPGFSRPERWTLQCVMHRTSLPALSPATFAVAAINTGLEFTVGEGFEISSQIEINAGRWTVRRRIVDSGALISVDTGIPGLTDVLAEIIYDNTTDPVLFARVNGAEFGRVQGLANIPVRPVAIGSGTVWHIQNIQGSAAAGAGQDLFRGFRLIIDELPGFV